MVLYDTVAVQNKSGDDRYCRYVLTTLEVLSSEMERQEHDNERYERLYQLARVTKLDICGYLMRDFFRKNGMARGKDATDEEEAPIVTTLEECLIKKGLMKKLLF